MSEILPNFLKLLNIIFFPLNWIQLVIFIQIFVVSICRHILIITAIYFLKNETFFFITEAGFSSQNARLFSIFLQKLQTSRSSAKSWKKISFCNIIFPSYIINWLYLINQVFQKWIKNVFYVFLKNIIRNFKKKNPTCAVVKIRTYKGTYTKKGTFGQF